MTKSQDTQQQAIAALTQLIGLSLSAARRAADMRTLQFGTLCPVDRGSVGDFALHIQCPWRIEGLDGIMTGRSDLWEPVESGPDIDREAWDYEKGPNLQDAQLEQLLAQHGQSLVVREVDANDFGDATVAFDGGYVLRLFPAGTRSEDWRLFRPATDDPHFVISGGKVESDE